MSSTYAIDSCLNGLAAYLRAQISALSVKTEWPRANEKLAMPAVTLFSGKVTAVNCQPEIIAQTLPDVSNQITITEVVGRYDFKMQLDLWCASKADRSNYFSLVKDALNKNVSTVQGENQAAGLSLQLTDYFNDWVRFDIDGMEYVDDEAAAQRQERRVRIDLLVNCRDIRQRSVYAMVNIETHVGAQVPVAPLIDNVSGTDVTEIEF